MKQSKQKPELDIVYGRKRNKKRKIELSRLLAVIFWVGGVKESMMM